MRKFDGDSLLIATHNAGKAREISALLSPYVSSFVTAGELNLPEPEETGATFVENAVLKAQAAAQANALGGDPGIYSARWGGENKDFSLAMQKVHDALGDSDDRSAYFVCVLAIGWPDGHSEVFEGRAYGDIVWPMRGDSGFGYDPVFQPEGYDITFAEMDAGEKQAISHRARAFELLVQNCLQG